MKRIFVLLICGIMIVGNFTFINAGIFDSLFNKKEESIKEKITVSPIMYYHNSERHYYEMDMQPDLTIKEINHYDYYYKFTVTNNTDKYQEVTFTINLIGKSEMKQKDLVHNPISVIPPKSTIQITSGILHNDRDNTYRFSKIEMQSFYTKEVEVTQVNK